MLCVACVCLVCMVCMRVHCILCRVVCFMDVCYEYVGCVCVSHALTSLPSF